MKNLAELRAEFKKLTKAMIHWKPRSLPCRTAPTNSGPSISVTRRPLA